MLELQHGAALRKYVETAWPDFDWEAGYRIDLTKNRDGQPEFVTGALYAQHFAVFADSMRAAARAIGKTICVFAEAFSWPAESYLAKFKDEFKAHIEQRKCPFGGKLSADS